MSVFFRNAPATDEQRNLSFQDVWGRGNDVSPIRGDSIHTALTLIPVYAATALIADQFAANPWASYNKGEATVDVKVPAQPRLLTDPSPTGQDLFSWKHQMISSLLLQGNAYGLILQTKLGVPSQVMWMRPDWITANEYDPLHPIFYYRGRQLDPTEFIHIPLYTVAGFQRGLSPIGLFREQIETGLQAQKVSRNFFRRGAVPSAHLRNTAKTLTADQAQTARARFVSSVSSSEPFVTGSDWDYKAIGLPQSDVAFMQGMKMAASQVASIYRVSPEMIGGETSASSLTYKNLEQDQIRFNMITMRPIAARIEAVINRWLMNGDYLKVDLDASVRADLKTRFEAHAIAMASKFKTADEVRADEDMNALTPEQIDQMTTLAPTTPPAIPSPGSSSLGATNA